MQTNVATIDFDDLEENHDFDDDDKTPVISTATMNEIMNDLAESVHSPGITTLTSDLPTMPHRPSIINNMERR